MTVVLVGVGADGGNVRPRPQLKPGRRFEYLPIPEKATATTESRTFGSMPQRYGEGPLADLLEGIKPHGAAGWLTDRRAIREHPVHYDPNFEALTYGEGGKDQNVAAIEELAPGDVLGFYTGLETEGWMHRYVFGYFTVAEEPTIITAGTPAERQRALLEAHGANAHAKRFEANDELYAFDEDRPPGASRVAIVDGRDPGGLLDRAVRLSGPVRSGHYYMAEPVEAELAPNRTHLGGFKNPIRCAVRPATFLDFLDRNQ